MPEVIMPKMGDAMTEGKVLRWIKQQGDAVRKGEAIAEIETDKVNVDLEAEWAGTLAQVIVDVGGVAPVGAPIGFIARPGEQVEQKPASRPAPTPAPTPAPAQATPTRPAAGVPARTPAAPGGTAAGDIRVSPLARRLAEQHGIPLASIKGTGPEGRITKEDVEAAIGGAPGAPAATPAVQPATNGAPTVAPPGTKDVALTRMRATIARRMTESKQQAPHIYLTVGIAMDAALAARRRINEQLPDERKVSVNDLVIKATALALTKHPNLNASFTGQAIRQSAAINISTAVALPDGLIAPTLYACDTNPLSQIALESKALAERARSGHLKPEDLSGGTFTISNLGMLGVDSFVAIINPPQSAILAVGTAKPTPVVKDGSVAVATVMQVTLSADHRVTDGAEAATFLGELRQLLEHPAWVDAEA